MISDIWIWSGRQMIVRFNIRIQLSWRNYASPDDQTSDLLITNN
jgi:hypothetical protein